MGRYAIAESRSPLVQEDRCRDTCLVRRKALRLALLH